MFAAGINSGAVFLAIDRIGTLGHQLDGRAVARLVHGHQLDGRAVARLVHGLAGRVPGIDPAKVAVHSLRSGCWIYELADRPLHRTQVYGDGGSLCPPK